MTRLHRGQPWCAAIVRGRDHVAVEVAVRGATDEIAQLRASAQALREALEDQAADHTQRLADAERAFRDERVQLTGMIAALREQLEGSDGG